MPTRASKPCNHPGCIELVPKGYCDKHKRVDETAKQRQDKRALRTNSTLWLRIRKMQLNANPLCADCYAKGVVTQAHHVDHIDNDSANNHASNLRSLCASCHSRKTYHQDSNFGGRRAG